MGTGKPERANNLQNVPPRIRLFIEQQQNAERRTSKRRRLLGVITGVVTLVAIGLLIYLFAPERKAKSQARPNIPVGQVEIKDLIYR